MRTVQWILLTIVSCLILIACGGDNSGSSTPPTTTTETRDIILFKGCKDSACNYNLMFIHDPETGVTTNVDNDLEVSFEDDKYIIYDGKIYFNGYQTASGYELWVVDPREEIIFGTNPKLVAEIDPSSTGGNPHNFAQLDGKIFFKADDGSNGQELWVYDPATATSATNPKMVANINPGAADSSPDDLTVVNGKLYFEAVDGTNGYEIWVYDPAVAISGTNPRLTINANASSDLNPNYWKVVGDKIYFCGADATAGVELHVLDTTIAYSSTNPGLIYDLSTGIGLGCYDTVGEINGKFYFGGQSSGEGSELFVYDPSQASSASNPSVVYDINSGAGSSSPDNFLLHNNKIYFAAKPAGVAHTEEPYEYDPSVVASATNPRIADINSGSGSIPSYFYPNGDKIFFSADDGVSGNELWVWDTAIAQSASNPSMVFDIESGGSDSSPDTIVIASNGKVYMSAETSAEGREFWSFDSLIAADSSNPTMLESITGTDEIYPDELIKFSYTVEVTQ